jgi:hypothetical protein
MLADLPWDPTRVRWQLRVRKFFCGHLQCPRRIFTARLPGVVAPWARRTPRLAAWVSAIGLALGGAAGTRLSQHVGLTVSRNTLLRVVRRLSLPSLATLKVLGVGSCTFSLRIIQLPENQVASLRFTDLRGGTRDGTRPAVLHLTFRTEALIVVHMHLYNQGSRFPRSWRRGWCSSVRLSTVGHGRGRSHT